MLLCNLGMKFGKAAKMGFVKDRVLPRNGEALVSAAPFEIRVDNDAFGHKGRAVALIEGGVVAGFHLVAEYGRVPNELSGMPSRVRVEK